MKHLHYAPTAATWKHVIVIKEDHFHGANLHQYYVQPLVEKGVEQKDILLLSLCSYGKRLIAAEGHQQLTILARLLDTIKCKNLLVADSAYYKMIMKKQKTAQDHGLVHKGKFPGFENINVCLSINYMAIKHNVNFNNQLAHSLSQFAKFILHGKSIFKTSVIQTSSYPTKVEDISGSLDELHQYPALTCDIETFGLRFDQAGIGTIAFAWDKHNGIAFDVSHTRKSGTAIIYDLLEDFFRAYKGRIWFYNALFDAKVLIYELFMRQKYDMQLMHQGLDILGNADDAMLYTYLATNTVGLNPLGLKENSYEFTGQYAIEEINDISKIELENLLEYNLIDALATWHTKDKYEPIVVAQNQKDLYNQIFQPSLRILIKMMLIGLPVSPEKVEQADEELNKIMSGYLKTITQSPLYAAINFNLRLIEQEKANAKLKKKFKTLRDFSDIIFNPGSDPQKQYVLYDLLGLEPIDFTDNGQPAVGKKTLNRLLTRLKTEHNLTDDDFK